MGANKILLRPLSKYKKIAGKRTLKGEGGTAMKAPKVYINNHKHLAGTELTIHDPSPSTKIIIC